MITLNQVKIDEQPDSDLTWEWDDEHSPKPFSPLMGDSIGLTWTGGSAYRAERLGIPYRVETRAIEGYAYYGEHFLEADQAAVIEKVKQAKRSHALILSEFWDREVWPAFSETYRWMNSLLVEYMSLRDVSAAWNEFWNRSSRLMGLHHMISTVVYQVLEDLVDLYLILFDGATPGEALRLVQGSSNELHGANCDLYDLAEVARTMPDVADLIIHEPQQALTGLAGIPEGQVFLERFNAFLHKHGHLGQDSIDIIALSWQDNPSMLLIEIRKRLLHQEEDPRQQRLRLVKDARVHLTNARQRLHDRPVDLQRFESALALALTVAPFKEDHNYCLDRKWQAHTHRFTIRVGLRLAQVEAIDEAEDIFYLHISEISEALNDGRDFRSLVTERKLDFARWSTTQPPKYVGKLPDVQEHPADIDQLPALAAGGNMLRGASACSGKVRGPARIVHSIEDFARVQHTDILVCDSPNPSWVSLYAIVTGLVTDKGGVLSHAAVLAREFGLPAVVGTQFATRFIRDGQWIEVDGSAGTVILL